MLFNVLKPRKERDVSKRSCLSDLGGLDSEFLQRSSGRRKGWRRRMSSKTWRTRPRHCRSRSWKRLVQHLQNKEQKKNIRPFAVWRRVTVFRPRSSLTWAGSSWRRRRRKPSVIGGRPSRCLTEHTCTPVSLKTPFHCQTWLLCYNCIFLVCDAFVSSPAGLSAGASKSPSHCSPGLTRVSSADRLSVTEANFISRLMSCNN